jgi:hypothetical protein
VVEEIPWVVADSRVEYVLIIVDVDFSHFVLDGSYWWRWGAKEGGSRSLWRMVHVYWFKGDNRV